MQISKSRFLNLLRCDRFAALNLIYQDKLDALVTTDHDSIEAIYSQENQYKKLEALRAMFESRYEDIEYDYEQLTDENLYEDLVKGNLEIPFDNDFLKIEVLAANALQNLYGGTITFGNVLKDQKHFESNYEGYKFHCFLDVFLENDDEIVICEVKATTNRKLITKGGRNPLFKKYGNIYRRNHEMEPNCKYVDEKAFKDPFHDLGRMSIDLAFQRFVIEQNAKKFNKPIRYLLAVLNSEYVYDGKKDKFGQNYYQDEIISFFDLTKLTEEIMPDIIKYANQVIERLNNANQNHTSIGRHCMIKKTRECPFYKLICQKDSNIPNENSILEFFNGHLGFLMPGDNLKNKSNRFDLINQGYTKIEHFKRENLIYPQQQIQLEAVTEDIRYIDKRNINRGLEMLKYPIYHLDFETFAAPLPRFKGEKCYEQSPFQYSLHIEREPGVCHEDDDHFEFIAKNPLDDCRNQLFKSLFSHLDNPNGTILAYNVSFEKAVINNYLKYNDHYKENIEPLVNNAFDLMDLIKGRSTLFPKEVAPNRILFYDKNLNGSYSIKKVLPVLAPELTYQNLNIQNGTDAVLEFSKLSHVSPNEYSQKVQDLLAYCKRDTWAMVVILQKLRELVK
ncbi:MAG: DUF2779 domain-containing protein [Acholeplasmataceae bacterium]